ncbi:hypothetical protein [Streptomyces collinus]
MDGMSIAGTAPVGQTVDRYVIYDDGAAGHLQVLDGTEPVLMRPGRFVTEEEYGARVLELREQTARYIAGLTAEDDARQAADYAALLAAGVAEESARRMAGYQGEGRP